MTASRITIVFALFPGVTQLDFTGPHQVLSRLPGAEVILASRTGEPIEADGIVFAGLRRLADIPRCDIVCVPGGFGATDNAIADAELLRELRRLADGARYVTSVCTGSLVLAAAGLLRGKRAACHWAWRDLLAAFGAIPDPARVVRDGNVVTGGGVTAGIDFALTLAAEIADADTAQAIQLGIEYAPAPPFNSGRPETAPAAVLARATERYAAGAAARRAAVEAAAARMPPAGALIGGAGVAEGGDFGRGVTNFGQHLVILLASGGGRPMPPPSCASRKPEPGAGQFAIRRGDAPNGPAI